MNIKKKTNLLEFVRFGLVGTIAAGLHYAIYYYLQTKINVNVAYTTGYLISLVCNFFMTSYLTFRTTPSAKKALGFGASHLINYLMHIVLLNFFLYLGISKEIAPIFVLAIAVPLNFFLLRFVFKRKKTVLPDTRN